MDFLALLVATGLVSGATYGLIAMGFALIYKSTGVVNFAQGELVMLTAYVSFSLANTLGLSFFPLLVVTVPISMAIGLVLERLIIRPMLGEPVFSIVMATVGLAVILRGIVVLIWGSEPLNFPAGLPTGVVSVAGVPFYPAQLCLLGALALVTLCAWLFLRFTRLGMAMRAVAANETGCIADGRQCRSHSRRRLDAVSRHRRGRRRAVCDQLQARAGYVVPGAQIVSRGHSRRA
jgi:branched-chain amino acid transport system permease protein